MLIQSVFHLAFGKDDVSCLDMPARHTRIDAGTACSVVISQVAARKTSCFAEMIERKLANEQFFAMEKPRSLQGLVPFCHLRLFFSQNRQRAAHSH